MDLIGRGYAGIDCSSLDPLFQSNSLVHVLQTQPLPVDLVVLGLGVRRTASYLGIPVEIETAPKSRRFLNQPASKGDVIQTGECVCLLELCRNRDLRGGPSKQRQRANPASVRCVDAVVDKPCPPI